MNLTDSGRLVWAGLLLLLVSATASSLDIPEVWSDTSRHQGFGEPYFGDLDGDGDLDMVLVHHGEGVYLWRHDGGRVWTEVTPADFASVDDPHGVALGDYDGDGDLDVFVSKGAASGRTVGKKVDPFFRNEGGFQFTEITREVGTDNTWGRGRSPLWFDHDGDRDLDLLILNYSSPHILYRNDGGVFTDITDSANLRRIGNLQVIRHPVDLDADGDMDLIVGGQAPDAYFENREGAFYNVSSRVGLGDYHGASTFAMADYDRDGDLDLFVARNWSDKKQQVFWNAARIAFSDKRTNVIPGLDFEATGILRFCLFRNSDPASGRIYLGAAKKLLEQHEFVLDPTSPDLVGEPAFGLLDKPAYYIWREAGLWHLRWNESDNGPYFYGEVQAEGGAVISVDKVDILEPQVQAYRDTLYRNDGGYFVDVTDQARIPTYNGVRTSGVAWADFDEDGWPDLYLVRPGLRVVGDAPDLILWNRRDGTFKNLSHVISTGRQGDAEGQGEGVAALDLNGDGPPDLFIKSGHAEPEPGAGRDKLFLNTRHRRRILVELKPSFSAPGAVGARVTVQVGPHRQLQENWGFAGGTSYGQGSGIPLHFGLGKAAAADVITVQWPAGQVQTALNVAANSRVVFWEGGPVTTASSDRRPPRPRLEVGAGLPAAGSPSLP